MISQSIEFNIILKKENFLFKIGIDELMLLKTKSL